MSVVVEPPDTTGPSGESKPADSPIEIYRHSSAHLLAAAVTELFPEAQCGIGPPTEDGFFYDFLVSRPFTPEDLVAIEKKMAHIVKQNRPIEKKLLPRAEAVDLFVKKGQTLKVKLIEKKVAGDAVQCYTMGDFIDFCLGPHLPSTSHIKAFKLKPEPSQSYWKGKEGNPAMQRIYGYAFFSREELDAHLHKLEEAKRRDHRRLGKELDLFSIADDTGAGADPLAPQGRRSSASRSRTTGATGTSRAATTSSTRRTSRNIKLWDTSGHTEYYKANMYSPIDIEGSRVPVEADELPVPHHDLPPAACASYRELPLRFAELGTVYRYERSGVLHGLLRVRGFTQDDAHIFCTQDQLEDEIVRVLDFVTSILKAFGFEDYEMYLSTATRRTSSGSRRAVGAWPRRRCARRWSVRGPQYEVDPGERHVLRAQDRPQDQGLARTARGSAPPSRSTSTLPKRFELEYIARGRQARTGR